MVAALGLAAAIGTRNPVLEDAANIAPGQAV